MPKPDKVQLQLQQQQWEQQQQQQENYWTSSSLINTDTKISDKIFAKQIQEPIKGSISHLNCDVWVSSQRCKVGSTHANQ